MLASGGVDVLQADATRCGVTGFLAASALCEARGVPLSAHCAPTIHAALGCAAPSVVHVEYFHDHARIESLLFDGGSTAERGVLRANVSTPGLGVSLKRADAEKYLVFDHVADGLR
jgi:L-alanine-DL-glutamate epimerase-like enolase superfamily enzyme